MPPGGCHRYRLHPPSRRNVNVGVRPALIRQPAHETYYTVYRAIALNFNPWISHSPYTIHPSSPVRRLSGNPPLNCRNVYAPRRGRVGDCSGRLFRQAFLPL